MAEASSWLEESEAPTGLWHINCLDLRVLHLAVEWFLPDTLHHHVLIRTDNTTVLVFINHQGGVSLWLAEDLLLLADQHQTIGAVHVSGHLNCA